MRNKKFSLDLLVVFGSLAGLGLAVGVYLFVRFVIFDNPVTTGDITQGDIISATATVLGGFGIGALAVMQYRKHMWEKNQAKLEDEQVRLDKDIRTGETLSKSIEHLGDENEHIRIGAIYELKRLAEDSERDRDAIGQILLKFIHRNTMYKDFKEIPLPQDVETAIYTLSYWSREFGGLRAKSICLEGIQLQHAFLQDADFEGANLIGANLWGANLTRANLSHVLFAKADLAGSTLKGANLETSIFDYGDIKIGILRIAKNRGLSSSMEEIFNDTGCASFKGAIIDEHTKFDPKVREKLFPNFQERE